MLIFSHQYSTIILYHVFTGPAVRMTVANMCHRRRLDSDAYSPPHIKRKHRINELLSRYQRRCTEPDFFTAVFTDQHNPRVSSCISYDLLSITIKLKFELIKFKQQEIIQISFIVAIDYGNVFEVWLG